MSRLADKLALLKRTGQAPIAAPNISKSRFESNLSLTTALLGEFEPTPFGDLLVIRRRYDIEHQYGNTVLKGSLDLPVDLLAKLYSGLDDFVMHDTLFFDTETTGLAGGSGTYAFLVGLGFFEGQTFVTEQLMMRDHSDEPALLSYFSKRLQSKTSLVSFNGRTFDAQLLATRYSMNRLSDPFAKRGHLDLLHVCRRLWGLSLLPDCRLETLESHVLKAPRHQDVPGWLIPSLFFDFLRDQDPRPLKGVVEHNRRDLLAMVGLCSHLHQLFTQKESPEPHLGLGLARFWQAVGQFEQSDRYFEEALQNKSLTPKAREKGLTVWARRLKSQYPERAAMLWRRTLSEFSHNVEATVELAKWFEHQKGDYRVALLLVERGLRNLDLTKVRRRELEHRAGRLRRRLG